MLAIGVLLLVLADAPESSRLNAGAGQEPAAMSSERIPPLTPWGTFPITKRDAPALEHMARRITRARLVRVRAEQGTFIGQIAEVRSQGLASLAPAPERAWSGPVDVLSWNDIRTIEVRRRSPARAGAAGGAYGAVLGVIGGIAYTKVNGGDDLAAGFIFGLGGFVVGGTVGFTIGCAVPIWDPLYAAR